MNKTALIIISSVLVIVMGFIFVGKSQINNEPVLIEDGKNVEIKDGVQYITIIAKGGYSPKTSIATAGIPTKLIIKTNGTYDCSSSLVIRSIGYKKILPQTGEEIIDLGIKNTGEILKGVCGMGMYNFEVRFEG